MTGGSEDKRAQRTRQALLGAFFGLVLERRYHEIKVADIIERAQVGRSTFYEHFPNKDSILASSLEGPFSVLADTVSRADNSAQLAMILQHFWDNRVSAKALLSGAIRREVTAVLVALIEQRFKQEGLGGAAAFVVPARLAAIQLAESMLAPLNAWLSGVSWCPPEALATALRGSVMASVAALRNPALPK